MFPPVHRSHIGYIFNAAANRRLCSWFLQCDSFNEQIIGMMTYGRWDLASLCGLSQHWKWHQCRSWGHFYWSNLPKGCITEPTHAECPAHWSSSRHREHINNISQWVEIRNCSTHTMSPIDWLASFVSQHWWLFKSRILTKLNFLQARYMLS